MKWNGKSLNTGNLVTLSGKSEFGKTFIEQNGTEYEIVKTEKWGEYRLLLKSLKENCETGLVWIGLLPESRNLKIEKIRRKNVRKKSI
tara:strand:- start:508 stop:771 length:264 start_codon:yes stop_codon:yes gene_type:complete